MPASAPTVRRDPNKELPPLPILKPDKEKDANKRPRVLLIPPPDLPVPAVQGGAVETLLTHLIRENCSSRWRWNCPRPMSSWLRAAT